MSKSFRGPALGAILSAGLAVAAAAPAQAETLADALALAYDSNPTLLAQRATQRALDESYVQARSGFRPQLSFQTSASFTEFATPLAARGQFIDTNGDGVPDTQLPVRGDGRTFVNSGFSGFSFSQPLWTGGRVASAVSAAEGDILSGRENLRRIEEQVMLQVIQAYLDVRRDQDARRIRLDNVTVLQKQLEESRAKQEVGEITRTDVAQSESRLAAARAQLANADAQLAISRANYASVVGQNPGELAAEPSLDFLLPATADDAFSIAEKFNPLLLAQQYAEQASRARVAQARAQRMPSVSLRAQYGYTGSINPLDTGKYSREVVGQAVVSMPLFTGGLTSSQVRQALERNNADRINIETQRRAVLQSVTSAWNQLVAAKANIDATAESVRAAGVAAEGTRLEEKVGLRTTLDILNAEEELHNDELSNTNARHDAYVAAANVLANMGRLEAKNLIPVVTQYDPKRNLRRLRFALGYVPWEEPVALVDKAVALPPIPTSRAAPSEAPIGPGLQPPPTPAAKAQPVGKK